MIRLFEFRDLDRIMEIWLEGNLKAHPFIKEEYWRQNYETVRFVLPNAEVYVFEEDGEVQGFIGMDAEYIAGLFVAEGHRGQGIGHQLISEVKRKKRLSLHVYEKNTGAVAFYRAEGFRVENSMTEKESGEQEYLMVFHDGNCD
ncbi:MULTISPECIES: N-acetyltransferase [Hungatella]|uniref:N-acetyltransferase n=1 Tax=Hungatella TaxID=1649459 RepID=UPI0011DD6AA1|nr:N-acetyltransferase [Hungatella hathewayi]